MAFVAYPVVFGLWMGHDPALYGLLMPDPRFADTAINTLVFVAIGVYARCSEPSCCGFFMRRIWWRRLLLAVFLIPWALPGFVVFTSIHFMLVTQWGLLDSLICGHRRGRAAVPRFHADRHDIEHRRLHLEMAAVLDADLRRRPHGDPAGHL